MIESLLGEAGLSLARLDGIAYGRGPGAFTGVRIAIGVVQGLAFGARLLTVGVSNLAAVAQQVAKPGDRVLVCMDARMGEVYRGLFECDAASGLVRESMAEEVAPPERVIMQMRSLPPVDILAGTGFSAYPQLASIGATGATFAALLPRAREIAVLGMHEFAGGRGRKAAEAQPVYLRNQVASVKRM
jgi:tRNA threonylcarbamoyladenosine biosynthesis protein TsaB